jgi:hypothetical protein
MPERLALNERLRELGHIDRGHHPGGHPDRFQRVHHRQRVDDGREHPHAVAGDAVDAFAGSGEAAENIPAPEHDADFTAELMDFFNALGHKRQIRRVDAFAGFAVAEHLAGELKQHSAEF